MSTGESLLIPYVKGSMVNQTRVSEENLALLGEIRDRQTVSAKVNKYVQNIIQNEKITSLEYGKLRVQCDEDLKNVEPSVGCLDGAMFIILSLTMFLFFINPCVSGVFAIVLVLLISVRLYISFSVKLTEKRETLEKDLSTLRWLEFFPEAYDGKGWKAHNGVH